MYATQLTSCIATLQEANRLIREALKESATDPTTGLIDVSYLEMRVCMS